MLALLITDEAGGLAALTANALLRRAGDEPFDPGQMSWQLLAARVRAHRGLGRARRQGFTLALGLNLGGTYPRLNFQEFQLRVGEPLTGRPVFVDAQQAQPLF